MAVDSVKVINEIKNTNPITGFHGPRITGGVNSQLNIATYEVYTGFSYGMGYIDLYQFATLLPQGTTNIRTEGGISSR